MTKVHYFQRYSGKENHITNNTLLLLSRIYSFDEEYFRVFFEELPDEVMLPVGVKFNQQIKEGTSIPDGLISQKKFKILIETKLGSSFRISQIENHIKDFSGEDTKIMMLISKRKIASKKKSEALKKVRKNDIQMVFVTFKDIINAANETIREYDDELKKVIDDYEDLCIKEKLIPRDKFRMIAFPCTKSIKENSKYNLYYEPTDRSTRDHKYIGIYAKKAIRYIGKKKKKGVVQVDLEKEIVSLKDKEKALTEEEKKNILNAAKEAKENRGWNISGERFYLVEQFYETNYNKVSSGGMRGKQYFDLGDILKRERLPESTEKIADLLKEKSWE